NKNRYCQFHRDHGHDTVHCRNLYAQVMMVIQAGKLKQYVKADGQAKKDTAGQDKGKQTQASGSEQQTLRIVPMIVGRPKPSQGREERDNIYKRTGERVKRLRSLGHSVNHLATEQAHTSAVPIAFTQQDLATVRLPHDDPLVVKLQIDSSMVGRVLIDRGSSADVLFLNTFENMGLNRSMLRPTYQPLFAFDSNRVSPLRVATLKVHATDRSLDVDFVVVDCQSSFNAIMGRGWIHAMHRVASTLHQVLRCQSTDGTHTIDIRGDQTSARKYFSTTMKGPAADTTIVTEDK
ncbi:hypothetical protein TorRG33x02_078950, partial [Trema orientale]